MKTTYQAALQKARNELGLNPYHIEVAELDLDADCNPDERAILECKMLGIPAWLHSHYSGYDS